MNTVTIRGTEHPFRYGYGALFRAEEALGKAWGEIPQNMYTQFVLVYSCFHNADAEFPYTFEEFIDICDEDQNVYVQCSELMARQIALWGKPANEEGDSDKKKD